MNALLVLAGPGQVAQTGAPPADRPQAAAQPPRPARWWCSRPAWARIKIELEPARRRPISVDNFLKYVRAGHYDGTIFHRVIPSFMIQGGGMDAAMKEKADAPAHQERGEERAPQRARHHRHGAHQRRPTAPPRSSSST